MELASAKAVISGGASGLGFATAQRVIDAGGQVECLDAISPTDNAAAVRHYSDPVLVPADVEGVRLYAAVSVDDKRGGDIVAVRLKGVSRGQCGCCRSGGRGGDQRQGVDGLKLLTAEGYDKQGQAN